MSIRDIITAADNQVTSTTWIGEMRDGTHEAILTFKLRKVAEVIAVALRAQGAKTKIVRTEYKEYILTVNF